MTLVGLDRNETTENIMERSTDTRLVPRRAEVFGRRSAIGILGAVLAIGNFTPWTISPSRSKEQGDKIMKQYAANKTIGEAVSGGGLLVVAQWEAKEGQADKVAAILDGFLPEAQKDPGAKLFLIGRNKDNPAQFLFYELFRDATESPSGKRLFQNLYRRPGLAAARQTRTRAIRAAVSLPETDETR
jgi:hypothetical protein